MSRRSSGRRKLSGIVSGLDSSRNSSRDVARSMRELLTAVESRSIRPDVVVTKLPIRRLLRYAGSSDRATADAAMEVAKLVLRSDVGLSEMTNPENASGLAKALTSGDEPMRRLVAAELTRTARKQPEAWLEGARASKLFHAVLKGLEDPSVGVASMNADTIVAVTATAKGLEATLGSTAITSMKESMQQGETVRVRVLSLLARLGNESPKHADAVIKSGLMSQLTRDLAVDDVLVQMTVVEVLAQMAESKAGCAFLIKLGVIDQLYKLLCKPDKTLDLLSNAILKFLGTAATAERGLTIVTRKAFVPGVLKHYLTSDDATTESRDFALQALGAIGAVPGGAALLIKTKAIGVIADNVTAPSQELRISAMHALAATLLSPDTRADAKASDDLAKAVRGISDAPYSLVFASVKQPIPDLRWAGFHLMQALSTYPWGLQGVLGEPAAVEWLTNRATEVEKQGKEWKYAVVAAMVENKDARTLISREIMRPLARFYDLGPFFVNTEAAVAVGDQASG